MTVSFISGSGKTGQLYVKERNENITLYHAKKKYLKWFKDLNVRLDTINLLEENIGITLFAINCSSIFSDTPPRVMKLKTKTNKWNLIKHKRLCITNKTINKIK